MEWDSAGRVGCRRLEFPHQRKIVFPPLSNGAGGRAGRPHPQRLGPSRHSARGPDRLHRSQRCSSTGSTMLQSSIALWCSILTLYFGSVKAFNRGRVTEKPDALNESPASSNSKSRSTHISEFTDPDTGFNPFLDLEEGGPAIGRKFLNDGNKDDNDFSDFDLVEGDGSNRDINRGGNSFGFDKDPITSDDKIKEEHLTTKQKMLATTIDYRTSTEIGKEIVINKVEEANIATEISVFTRTDKKMLYAAIAIPIVAVICILIIAFLWRRFRRMSMSHVAVQVDELKT